MSKVIWYKLVEKQPVEATREEGAMQFEDPATRRVAFTQIGDVDVSTVFLALDHGFGVGPPTLFETMVFGGEHDQEQERYATWEEAEAGHERWVAKVKDGAGP